MSEKKEKPGLYYLVIVVYLAILVLAGKCIYEVSQVSTSNGCAAEEWKTIQGGGYCFNILIVYALGVYIYYHEKLNFIENTSKKIDCVRLLILMVAISFNILYVNSYILYHNAGFAELQSAMGSVVLLTIIFCHYCHNYEKHLAKTESLLQNARGIMTRFFADIIICTIYILVILNTSTVDGLKADSFISLLF